MQPSGVGMGYILIVYKKGDKKSWKDKKKSIKLSFPPPKEPIDRK